MSPIVDLPNIQEDVVEDVDQEAVIEPPYHVIIHNDDVTPMDFVVAVLVRIFALTVPDAEYVMLTAHLNGRALVTTLPRSEAQKKIGKAHFAASLEGYPLRFTAEPAE